jgi:hypothetical protein
MQGTGTVATSFDTQGWSGHNPYPPCLQKLGSAIFWLHEKLNEAKFLVFSFIVRVLMDTWNGGIGHNVFGFCPLCKVLPPQQCLSCGNGTEFLKFLFICNFSDAFSDKGGQAAWMLRGKKVRCATSFLDAFYQEVWPSPPGAFQGEMRPYSMDASPKQIPCSLDAWTTRKASSCTL